MPLEGYARLEGRRKGGITRIAVAGIDAVSKVGFDKATGFVADVELAEGEHFALYNFMEDSASLTETTETHTGFLLVRRELTFTLERLDERERAAADQLLRNSARGYVVIALNGCGTAFLLGYSRKLGGRFPMKVKRAVASTGSAPEDTAGKAITFYHEDVEKMPVYNGPCPTAQP